MAIQVRILGSGTDTPRKLEYTSVGTPRLTFGVRVGTVRKRHYLVIAYAAAARFADLFLRTGQRVRIEGAYLRRQPPFERRIRADTVRHVGTALPPYTGSMVSFVPKVPSVTTATPDARPVPHAQAPAGGPATSALNDAVAEALS